MQELGWNGVQLGNSSVGAKSLRSMGTIALPNDVNDINRKVLFKLNSCTSYGQMFPIVPAGSCGPGSSKSMSKMVFILQAYTIG